MSTKTNTNQTLKAPFTVLGAGGMFSQSEILNQSWLVDEMLEIEPSLAEKIDQCDPCVSESDKEIMK